ncbi:MAG: chemotaxis protein CheX [Treponema sp.]|nr:chemotaxis protein CheX [Treponema sp.]
MSEFTTEKLSYIFIDALTDVVSKMAGLSFNVLSEEADSAFDENTAVMSLGGASNGKNHGMLFISAKEKDLRIIGSFMTGIPINEITENDIEDTLCELVNMTAGNAKLRTNSMEQIYTITPPFLLKADNLAIKTKKRINVISRILGNDEISVKIKVIFYT